MKLYFEFFKFRFKLRHILMISILYIILLSSTMCGCVMIDNTTSSNLEGFSLFQSSYFQQEKKKDTSKQNAYIHDKYDHELNSYNTITEPVVSYEKNILTTNIETSVQ
jgi:hypothetical protein